MAFKILNDNLDYFDHFLEVIEEFMKKIIIYNQLINLS